MLSRRLLRFHEWVDALVILGVLFAVSGTYWDIQYHIDIGRDSFWIAPHRMVYAGIVLVFFTSLAALFYLKKIPAYRDTHKKFRTAVLLLFGSVTLFLLGAPFDELWHRLYGLDVTVWSPPHLYLIAAGFAIVLSLIYFQRLYLSVTRKDRVRHVSLDELGLELVCALGLVGLNIIFAEFEFFQDVVSYDFFHLRHNWIYLFGVSTIFVFVLSLAKTLTYMRWAATRIAFLYFAIRVLITIVLLSAGAGVSYPMLPAFAFIPAILFDMLYDRHRLLRVAVASAVFVGVLYAVQTIVFSVEGITKYLPSSSVEVALALLVGIVAGFSGSVLGRKILSRIRG
ncbi:MAG: hypothetical protein AAB699_03380 [Patescibacteria group bacterium]